MKAFKQTRSIYSFMLIVCIVVFTGCGGSGGGGSSDIDDPIVGEDNFTYYRDSDEDGYGDPSDTTEADSPPTGYVIDDTDCDDSDADINPGKTEICTDVVDNNCDGDADTADSICAVTLMEEGVFTMVNFYGYTLGGIWDVGSKAFEIRLDGVDIVDIDQDRDSDFSDATSTYEALEDGSFSIDGGPIGNYSEDESIIAMTEADLTDAMAFHIGVREGTDMSIETFDGPYLVMKFAANLATGMVHTYTAMADKTAEGLGIFGILRSSDPAAVNVTSPFTYTIEPNGNIEFVDSHEEGKIRSDGSFFMAADTDTSNDLETVMMALRLDASGTMTNADLSGEYLANLVGYNLATGDYWTARVLATFDGVGLVRYEFLASTSGGGGATGYVAYLIDGSGLLTVGPPWQFGAVSADGQMFCVVDTTTADNQIYLMVGIKRLS